MALTNIKRMNFEKLILVLFIMSWINLPGVIYEKWSLVFLTNGHGKNLIPYLLPALSLFFSYCFIRSDWNGQFKNLLYGRATMIINKSTMEDWVFVVLLVYMVMINLITAIIDYSESNFRMIMPLITAHFFYWLYKRYSNISKIVNVDVFFAQVVFFSILCMLIIQILMFIDIVPGLTDPFSADNQQKLGNFIQVNGKNLGFTSYTALILLFLLLFHKFKLPTYIIVTGYVVIALALVINQTRGALLPAVCLVFLYFSTKLSLRRAVILGSLIAILMFLYLNNLDHRVFSINSSAQERIFLISRTIDVFSESPIFGRGSYFVQNLRFSFIDQNFVVHNYYVRFLTAYGLFGFMIFLCYLQPLFLKRFTFKNLVGLFVVFSICTFETYYMWSFLIIATFHQNEQKRTAVAAQDD